ncbi:hypothetical protein G7Y89_g4461 [Cudoniella acicularis]|uniref:Cytochrome P450 n=1 Tax=Cudoniella acicularis TaxID=354080 RepID=A0A8H4RSE5_9HELO|nr:hypothetical protein G7Y89_g4461 [Cudoniella acicularis]
MSGPVSLLVTFLMLSVAIAINRICLPLIKNIRTAKATGLCFIVVPYYHYNFLTARLMSRTLLRLCNLLCPGPSFTSWRVLVTSAWPLKLQHAPFKALGTDTFLIVAPGGIILNTADADVISQVLARGQDFPKATEIYRSINIYGRNVVSSDGPIWRHHRKITSPAFSERNNHLVWKETLDRTQAMLASFVGADGQFRTVEHIARDTTRLSLEVMGRACLGEKLEWPSNIVGNNRQLGESCSDTVSQSFTSSLEYVALHIVSIMAIKALPEWIIRTILFIPCKKSLEAYDDWGRHMRSMISRKRSEIKTGFVEAAATDLIGQLVRSQDDFVDGKSQRVALTDSEVLGNLFVFIVAGHETSANTIHFALLLLALHPMAQKMAQSELVKIFKGRPIASWSFDQDLPLLLNGMLGAVLNEVLRLISLVLTIPKVVTSPSQSLLVDGNEVQIPGKTLIRLCVPAVHRNPKFWPSGPPTDPGKLLFPLDNLDNDLGEFKPERWLDRSRTRLSTAEKGYGSPAPTPCSSDDNSGLYTPVKGAFIPFSDGQRSCLGRRFAQVEILTALAVILSEYSVELAVDEWASDEEVRKMASDKRREVWSKARQKGEFALQNKLVSIITVQLNGTSIPLRFSKKGHERFYDL